MSSSFRRSLHSKNVDDVVQINDDTEERNRSHRQLSMEDEDELEENLNTNMDDVLNHFNSCIHLYSENKINAKNAFSLHFIEGFSALLKEKHTELKDFATIGHSLDAGIKIYCCRVDNAYADTVKLADSIQKVTQMKKNSKKVDNKDEQVDDKIIGRDGNVNDEDADKAKNVKSRKNKKKKVIFINDENASKYKRIKKVPNPLKNVMRIFQAGDIVSSGVFDRNSYSRSLDNKRKYWDTTAASSIERSTVSLEVDMPDLTDDAVICRTFRKLKFTRSDTSILKKCDALSVVTREPKEFNVTEEENCELFNTDYETCDNTEESMSPINNIDEPFANNTSHDVYKNIINCPHLSKDDEYGYLDYLKVSGMLARAKNTKHWNPFPQTPKIKEKRSRTKKDKKSRPIDFYDTSCLTEIYGPDARKATFVSHNWPKARYIPTPDWDLTISRLLSLTYIRGLKLFDKQEIEEIKRLDISNVNSDLNQTQLFVGLQEDDAEDSDNIHNDLYGDDNEQDDDVDRANRSQIDAAFLYDEPSKSIDVYHRTKQVNINHLKTLLWDLISEQLCGSPDKVDFVRFSDICLRIVEDKKYKETYVTANIICNALLHLANSERLMITPIDFDGCADGDLEIRLA